jgi:hypothetical protein
METFFPYIVGVLVGIVVSIIIYFFIKSTLEEGCKHDWKLIRDGDIVRGKTDTVVGFMKVYECPKCKNIKTNKAYIND